MILPGRFRRWTDPVPPPPCQAELARAASDTFWLMLLLAVTLGGVVLTVVWILV